MSRVVTLQKERADALSCSGCGASELATSAFTGEIYCLKCGLVLL